MIVPTLSCSQRSANVAQWVKFGTGWKYTPRGWDIVVGPRINLPRYQYVLFITWFYRSDRDSPDLRLL